jgi:hypothetical protein
MDIIIKNTCKKFPNSSPVTEIVIRENVHPDEELIIEIHSLSFKDAKHFLEAFKDWHEKDYFLYRNNINLVEFHNFMHKVISDIYNRSKAISDELKHQKAFEQAH